MSYRKSGLLSFFVVLLIALVIAAIAVGIAFAVNNCRFGHSYDDEGVCIRCGEKRQETPTPDKDTDIDKEPDVDKDPDPDPDPKPDPDPDIDPDTDPDPQPAPDDGKFGVVVDGVKYTENANVSLLGKAITVCGCESFAYKFVPYFPEEKGNFVYMADGVPCGYSSLNELTDGFSVSVTDNILYVQSTDMIRVLGKLHDWALIEIPNPVMIAGYINAALVITASDGQSVTLAFTVPIPLS